MFLDYRFFIKNYFRNWHLHFMVVINVCIYVCIYILTTSIIISCVMYTHLHDSKIMPILEMIFRMILHVKCNVLHQQLSLTFIGKYDIYIIQEQYLYVLLIRIVRDHDCRCKDKKYDTISLYSCTCTNWLILLE